MGDYHAHVSRDDCRAVIFYVSESGNSTGRTVKA